MSLTSYLTDTDVRVILDQVTNRRAVKGHESLTILIILIKLLFASLFSLQLILLNVFLSPRHGRKSSVKYEYITMCTTPQLAPESGMAKWNFIFQVRHVHFE